jgi:hypothetical protein
MVYRRSHFARRNLPGDLAYMMVEQRRRFVLE